MPKAKEEPVMSEAPAPAPLMTFDEFSATSGQSAVLLAGFLAYCRINREPMRRSREEWARGLSEWGARASGA